MAHPPASAYAGPTHPQEQHMYEHRALRLPLNPMDLTAFGICSPPTGPDVQLRPQKRIAADKAMCCWGRGKRTYRYIQLLVSRLGLPLNHSGANVIQPSVAVNHVSASYSHNQRQTSHLITPRAGPTYRLTNCKFTISNSCTCYCPW